MRRAAGRCGRLRVGLADLAFRLTTAPLRPARIEEIGLSAIAAPWLAAGGTLRVAAPKWYAVWCHDTDRMARLHTVILPALWVGLSETEMAALLIRRLQAIGSDLGDHPILFTALARAEAKLQQAIMSGG